MVHEKIEEYPHGMTEKEAEVLYSLEDIYDIFETFDTLEDALNFIKENEGEEAYEYALEELNQEIKEEREQEKYEHENGNLDYVGYTTFNTKFKPSITDKSYVWFTTGKVVRVEFC